MTPTRARPRGLLALALAALLGGCFDDMTQQPKVQTYRSTDAFPDRRSARLPPNGTVARDDLARDAAFATPPPVTPALLARGRQRFDINCSPCHGRDGYGEGIVVQRGFPVPPSYHIPRLRAAPARHFLDVITNGYGVMYSYASRVEPADRWAIIAYIRALQASQDKALVTARAGGGS